MGAVNAIPTFPVPASTFYSAYRVPYRREVTMMLSASGAECGRPGTNRTGAAVRAVAPEVPEDFRVDGVPD